MKEGSIKIFVSVWLVQKKLKKMTAKKWSANSFNLQKRFVVFWQRFDKDMVLVRQFEKEKFKLKK
jgi:hypothetical protein